MAVNFTENFAEHPPQKKWWRKFVEILTEFSRSPPGRGVRPKFASGSVRFERCADRVERTEPRGQRTPRILRRIFFMLRGVSDVSRGSFAIPAFPGSRRGRGGVSRRVPCRTDRTAPKTDQTAPKTPRGPPSAVFRGSVG